MHSIYVPSLYFQHHSLSFHPPPQKSDLELEWISHTPGSLYLFPMAFGASSIISPPSELRPPVLSVDCMPAPLGGVM